MIKFELIQDQKSFEEFQDQWNRCLDRSGIKSAFLRWEWQFSWWEQYFEKLNDPQLCIILGYENDELKLIFPGFIENKKTMLGSERALQFIGCRLESTDYLSVICEESDRMKYLPELFTYLHEKLSGVDRWEFINVLENDSLLPAVEKFAINNKLVMARHHHRICPYISTTGSWDDFVAGLSKNMRYNLRRRTRNMLEKMDAKFEMIADKAQVGSAVSRLFALHEKRWDTREGTSIFKKDLRLNFHQAVSSRFFDADILKLFYIRVGEEIAAMLYCFEFAGELMYFQAGFDPHYEKQSIGLVLMGKCIEYSFDKGLTRFDFMRGAENYKFKWTQDVRNMDEIIIGVSAAGKRSLHIDEALLKGKESIKKVVPEESWEKLKKLLGRS